MIKRTKLRGDEAAPARAHTHIHTHTPTHTTHTHTTHTHTLTHTHTHTHISNIWYHSITDKRSPQFSEEARFAKSLHPFIVPFSGTSEGGCS